MKYVAGFLFTSDHKFVVLIEKQKPDWQKGKLNGVGGKIEEGETPLMAMQREFEEETGLNIDNWREFFVLRARFGVVHFFVAESDSVGKVRTMEDEQVDVYDVNLLPPALLVGNLNWLIPLAMDQYRAIGILD